MGVSVTIEAREGVRRKWWSSKSIDWRREMRKHWKTWFFCVALALTGGKYAFACICTAGDYGCIGDCCYPQANGCLCVDRGIGSCS
jgi:hypothetical protein